MPFKAETYRVLIASPSDLGEERRAATEAINDWNAQHAAAEGVVLLPGKWETHATPEIGVRPQGAINRQLASTSDLLVGMFWTKLGTSTGVAESGTVEEIDQFVAAGRPAMLYFSSRPVDPNRIDLKQQRKLRQFKNETYKTALVGGFASAAELHGTLLRDLVNQVRLMRNGRRPPRGDKLEQASKITELMLLHKQHDITPEQIDRYRELLGLRRNSGKSKPKDETPVAGLFFDYAGTIWATINTDEREEGWSCCVDICGDNYETKKFEVVSLAVNRGFDTSDDAIKHGRKVLRLLNVECLETRVDEL